MTKVLITGATGFVGRVLCGQLAARGTAVRAAVRKLPQSLPPPFMNGGLGGILDDVEQVAVGRIGCATDWRDALRDVDAVVHLAARVHVMHETRSNPLGAFRRMNVEGTERLARQAADAGVRRLIYVSSIKVNGETSGNQAFTAEDAPGPRDPYATSKWEAEQALLTLAEKTGMEVVIVRPPLVYGPRVKGNFFRLLRLVDSGLPLPLGALTNSRSLVGIDNLCDMLRHCLEHAAATNRVFLVSDDEDLSTRDLVLRLAEAMNRPVRLVPVPPALLRLAGVVTGRSAEIRRLCETLQVDMTNTRLTLKWQPPVSVLKGLRDTVGWYLSEKAERNG